MRVILLICFALVIPAFSFAGPLVDSRSVSYKSGDETVNAVLYTPEHKGRLPALVVIHEWWGLNDWVKQQAQKLAEEGYVTLAIDLYRGNSTADPEEAHELMRGLPPDRALRDLRAAVAYVKTLKNVDPQRIGSIGWCTGGGWSLALAENDPTLKAAVVNYGALPSDAATLQPIHAAILGIFGGQDRSIPPESVNAFAKQMKTLHETVETKIYPDAGHAFQNPNNKKGHRPEDTADAWKLTVQFLAKHLKK